MNQGCPRSSCLIGCPWTIECYVRFSYEYIGIVNLLYFQFLHGRFHCHGDRFSEISSVSWTWPEIWPPAHTPAGICPFNAYLAFAYHANPSIRSLCSAIQDDIGMCKFSLILTHLYTTIYIWFLSILNALGQNVPSQSLHSSLWSGGLSLISHVDRLMYMLLQTSLLMLFPIL